MIKNKEELLSAFAELIGENNSDEVIAFLEDLTDTFDDFGERLSEDWKSKYEENDRDWREKYTKRFYSGPDEEVVEEIEVIKPDETESSVLEFEDLFEKEEL